MKDVFALSQGFLDIKTVYAVCPYQFPSFGQVSSVEIERICNAVDNNVLETAAIGVPPPGGGPEQLVIAVVFKDSDNMKADLNQLKILFNSAVQKNLNPLFRVLMFASHIVAFQIKLLDGQSNRYSELCRFFGWCLSQLFQGQQQIRL